MKLYSYGNAHEKKLPDGHYSYECQHGGLECLGNFIEACIQKETNFKPELYFPIIECMEAARNPILVAKQCFEIFAPELKWTDVHLCAHVSNRVYNVIYRVYHMFSPDINYQILRNVCTLAKNIFMQDIDMGVVYNGIGQFFNKTSP